MENTNLFLAGLMPSGAEWIIVLFIVLLLFGSTKLPQLAKGLGQSIKEFKKAAKEGDAEAAQEKAAATDTKKIETTTTRHGAN